MHRTADVKCERSFAEHCQCQPAYGCIKTCISYADRSMPMVETRKTFLTTDSDETVMQGTVQGGRRRGRQRKRWEDNFPEWTGLTLGAAMRKAERREEWRELVAKSSVVPQRSTETTGKARQGKARQGKARQGKARQGKARQGKARQGKARQGKARQGKARQGKARQGKARQGKASDENDGMKSAVFCHGDNCRTFVDVT